MSELTEKIAREHELNILGSCRCGIFLGTAMAWAKHCMEVTETAVLNGDKQSDGPVMAWYTLADHEAFKQCRDEERPLLDAILDRLTGLLDTEAAVVELAPAPVKPSREDIAYVIAEDIWTDDVGDIKPWGCLTPTERENVAENYDAWRAADAVLALLPGRSEAEVKAEALREAAAHCDRDWPDLPGVGTVGEWLEDRANEIERG